MRRTILPIAAILLTAACSSGGSDTASKPAHTSTPRATRSSHSAAPEPSASHVAKPKPKPKPSRSKGCGPERDVIVWYKTPGAPNSAQVIGNYNVTSCQTTFDELQQDSPTGDGYCTEAAWASDNPGYNADADSPKRLKNVQVSVGPAC
ncbi:hypothetical protein SRB17_05550 [Streptomyces sp. RB17]|uniref:hypothetical protein n=1 Tax=Streptomyces sp. RB17 TaxID=2585197 RepID=UPI001297147D|nr:hypothetical protein [Streptomyces sp. RB17]MQY32601.1 hypothetical protein [Streptomyces sp. RB17]